MTQSDRLSPLNRFFIMVYRSFGQYVREAWPNFDVAEDEVRAIVDCQTRDVERLARYIIGADGSLSQGAFPLAYTDLHYMNASWLLPQWTAAQRKLVAELERDQAKLTALPVEAAELVDTIVAHERDALAKLESLSHAVPSAH